MHVQIHYQGLEPSPWINQFIEKRLSKLNRYLLKSSSIQVHLKFVNKHYVTSLAIHQPNHDFAFNAEGENLYESFSSAIDKAGRALEERKRRLKDRIHGRFFSLKRGLEAA